MRKSSDSKLFQPSWDCPLVASLSVLFLTTFPAQVRPQVFLFWLTTTAQSVWTCRGQGLTDTFTIRRAPRTLVTEQIRFSVRSWRHTEARVWLLCVEAFGKTSDKFTVGKFWPVRFMSFLKNLTGGRNGPSQGVIEWSIEPGAWDGHTAECGWRRGSQASKQSREGDSPRCTLGLMTASPGIRK